MTSFARNLAIDSISPSGTALSLSWCASGYRRVGSRWGRRPPGVALTRNRAHSADGEPGTDLPRQKLHRRLTPPAGAEAAYVRDGTRCRILLRVGLIDGVANAFTSRTDGSNWNLPLPHLDRTERVLEERSIPPPRLLGPRAAKNAPLDDNSPDPNEAMPGPGAGPDSEDRALVNGRHECA